MIIFVAILLLILIWLIRIKKVELLSPLGIQCFIWIFFIVGSYATIASKYHIYNEGIIWILFYCILSIFVYTQFDRSSSPNDPTLLFAEIREIRIPWGALKLFILLSFIPIVLEMKQNGISLGLFGNLDALQNVSHEMAVQHYESAEEPSTLQQVFNTMLYVSPLCSGYSIVHAKNRRERLLCLASIVPVLISVLITTAKLALVAYIILFYVAYLISYIFSHGRVMRINGKIVKWTVILSSCVFAIFILSFWLRIGESGTSGISLIVEKLSIYMFGHIQGFDVWFHQNAFEVNPTFGAGTFLAISSRLGISSQKVMGVYDVIPEACTNVYTQFRPLIEDYTPFFALIFVVMMNSLLAVEIHSIRQGSNSPLRQTVAAMILFYFLYFIISAWIYTTYILAFFFFFIFLCLTFRIKAQKIHFEFKNIKGKKE